MVGEARARREWHVSSIADYRLDGLRSDSRFRSRAQADKHFRKSCCSDVQGAGDAFNGRGRFGPRMYGLRSECNDALRSRALGQPQIGGRGRDLGKCAVPVYAEHV